MSQCMDSELLEKELITHTINYISKIATYVKPQELLYIAIDGIPPNAKILQQRKRRFVGSWRQTIIDKKRLECNVAFTQWDRNAITPGTQFMNKLSDSLQAHFSGSSKFPYNIILSDSSQPGEGEAKILDYIKDTPIPLEADVIYGLDADLIMLGLLSNSNNIFLLREPVHYDMKVSIPFMLFNITLLRHYVSVECGLEDVDHEGNAILNASTYDKNTVWDYVVLCFLQGNDFMPSLSFLKIRHNGIEMTVEIYKKIRSELNQYLVVREKHTKRFEVNYMFLVKILECLKSNEDQYMCEAEDEYYSRKMPFVGRKHPVDRLAFEIDNYPSLNKFPRIICPEKPGWRLRYYHSLFHETTEIHEINDVCLNYLEAIQWTTDYYFNRCLSRDWYFKYNYGPTVMDLHNFLLINLEDTKTFVESSIQTRYPKIKYDTDLQLLMCLPPSSCHLLKGELKRVMHDVELGCVHLYPKTFKFTGYLKSYLWEAHPDLPLVDPTYLSRIKNELMSTLPRFA